MVERLRPTEIIYFLKQILTEKESEKKAHIIAFQKGVFNNEYFKDERLNEILNELAYDLDFYEPNDEWREEDVSFYSEPRLRELINEGIKKIEGYTNNTY